MNFIRTEIADVVIIEPKIFQDDRGYFLNHLGKIYLKNLLLKKLILFKKTNLNLIMVY